MVGTHQILLSEGSQTQKSTFCMQNTKTRKQRVLGAWGAGSLGSREGLVLTGLAIYWGTASLKCTFLHVLYVILQPKV